MSRPSPLTVLCWLRGSRSLKSSCRTKTAVSPVNCAYIFGLSFVAESLAPLHSLCGVERTGDFYRLVRRQHVAPPWVM